MTTVEVLRGARALLAVHGWCQEEFLNAAGCYCAAGALNDAAGSTAQWSNGDSRDARDALKAALGEFSVLAWNDVPGRTVDEVLAAFDRAIATEEARS